MSTYTEKTPEEKAKLAENQRKWRANNSEHFRSQERDRALRRRYGITREDFNRLLEEQDFKCKICGLEYNDTEGRRTLHVDHEHETGKVRGLLCNGCNRGLGFFNDSIEIVIKAADYLRGTNGRK